MTKSLRKVAVLALAGAALAAPPALANGGGDNGPSERGEGAPGRVCKQQGHDPGTQEFRTCVTTLAHRRGQSQQAQRQERKAERQERKAERQERKAERQERKAERQKQQNASERGRGAPGRVCKQRGHEPGTQAFRECVRTLAKQRRQKS